MNKQRTLAMLFSSAALLTGCGGGDDAPAPPPPTAATDAIPPTAAATAAGFTLYLVDLNKDQTDKKEALDVASFAPVLDDTGEPQAVD
jgi:hypothetical protein